MKVRDIKPGVKYAIKRRHIVAPAVVIDVQGWVEGYGGFGHTERTAERVIDGVTYEIPTHCRPARDYEATKAGQSVLVQMVKNDGSFYRWAVVQAFAVIGEWDEYVANDKAEKAAAAKARAERDREAAEARELYDATVVRLAKAGIEPDPYGGGATVTISVADVNFLLDIIEGAQ